MTNVSSKQYRSWAVELGNLEDKIDALQEQKKQVYARIRRDFSKLAAEGMRGAMRLMRMDPGRRAERLRFDKESARVLDILLSDKGTENDDPARQRANEGPSSPSPHAVIQPVAVAETESKGTPATSERNRHTLPDDTNDVAKNLDQELAELEDEEIEELDLSDQEEYPERRNAA
ncbi:hypothetical protein [Nitratireductor alexandrii]|uniref:hypothetical protein n=1 Tax=Nitratireductor alexandrii TaxID=2448161 RepID=UPI000FDBD78B|nr:hypothetical protein [Nitratireductor alexandrii]